MNDRFHHLFVRTADFERSLAFYRDTLGWDVIETWGDEGKERGAILSGGGVKVVIAEQPKDPKADVPAPAVHLDIHDIDKRFKVMPKGDHVVAPPSDTPWKTRWFVVRDPDGNMIAFEEVHRSG